MLSTNPTTAERESLHSDFHDGRIPTGSHLNENASSTDVRSAYKYLSLFNFFKNLVLIIIA